MNKEVISTKRNIHIPLYHGRVQVHLVNKWEEFAEKMRLGHITPYNAVVWKDNDDFTYHVAFSKGARKVSIIAHEVTHLVNLIFKDRCIKVDFDNDEPQAYFTGWLVGEIYKFMFNI